MTLTREEQRAVALLARGYDIRDVADALGKSRETVKTQLAKARIRIGARRTGDLVFLWIADRAGLDPYVLRRNLEAPLGLHLATPRVDCEHTAV